jgi:hypothetical protein
MFTSLAEEANFGYAVPAGPQVPPAVGLPALGLDGLVLTPVEGREREALRHGERVEVVATASEPLASCWCRGGRRR